MQIACPDQHGQLLVSTQFPAILTRDIVACSVDCEPEVTTRLELTGTAAMNQRVLIPLAGLGTFALDREQFDAGIAAGLELNSGSPACTPKVEALLDADQAAQQCSVSARWLEDSARAGIIPHYKLGRFIRYRVSEIVAHCRVEGAAIPGTSLATDTQSVGRSRSFEHQ